MRQAMYAVGAIAVLVIFLFVREQPTEIGPDLAIYSQTVSEMKSGAGYYQAMYDALSRTNGAPSEARSYRLPTVFLLWRYTGLTWAIVLLVIIASGWEVALLSNPVFGVFTAAYLAIIAVPPGVPALYGWIEYWALPFVLAAMLSIRRDRWAFAAVCILMAALVRETVAPLFLSGALAAWLAHRSVRPWLLSLVAWTAFLYWHLQQVRLSPNGQEMRLVGTGGFGSMIDMMSPALGLLGAAVVCYAIWHGRFTAEWWLTLPLLVGIPLSGLVVSRDYWGILVFPVALVLAGTHEPRVRPRGLVGQAEPSRELG
jgi:hypothetical protein